VLGDDLTTDTVALTATGSSTSHYGNYGLTGIAGFQVVGHSQPVDRIASTDPASGGNDQISLGQGSNIVIGGPRDDTISAAGPGSNLIAGDDARVTPVFGAVREMHTTNPEIVGNDVISTGAGADIVLGGSRDDILNGGAGNDRIYGEDGNDLLAGGGGNDFIDGGDGTNLLDFPGAQTGVVVTLSDWGTGTAPDGLGGTDTLDDIQGAIGTAFADRMIGNNDGNLFYGMGGADYIDGRGGSDLLVGRTGNDTILGGSGGETVVWNEGDGNDTIDLGSGWNTLIVNAGAGDDLLSVAAAGSGLVTVSGSGAAGSSAWSLSVDDADLIEVNTTDANAMVHVGSLRGTDVRSVMVHPGTPDTLLACSPWDDLSWIF
jgi:Ca2+-binding RTX toxin-like protein